jgi:capsular polysaccharide biosynthesis protein
MDVAEAAQRILRVRGLVVLAFVLLGLAAGYAVHRLEPTTYTATARLVVNRTVPQDASEAQALAGTVQGIVTSPDRVTAALRKAGISRDLLKFTKEISAQSLGDSGIVALSVMDTDARAAATVSNTLAKDAVTTINQPDLAGQQLAIQLQAQIDNLTVQRNALDAQIRITFDTVQKDALTAQRTDLTQQLATLTSKLVDLHQQQTQAPEAGIVDAAATPTRTDPSRLPLDLIIGALGGLVLGVGAAALLEGLRPTLVGERAIERALGTPVLGTLGSAHGGSDAELLALSARIRHAARRARVSSALLWSPVDRMDLRSLTQRLQSAQAHANPRLPAAVAIRTLGQAGGEEASAGMIAVLPPISRQRSVSEAEVVCTAHGWPLLGAVICPAPSRRYVRRAERLATKPSEVMAS